VNPEIRPRLHVRLVERVQADEPDRDVEEHEHERGTQIPERDARGAALPLREGLEGAQAPGEQGGRRPITTSGTVAIAAANGRFFSES
jgi:hypothetical protein